MSNPIDNPGLYDFITLDDEKIPVLVKRTGGLNREIVVEQQQSPGFAGAYTVVKQEKLISGTYRFHCWLPAHFATMATWIDRFRSGNKRRPPRVYRIGDPAVAHNELKQIVISDVSALIEVSHSPIMYAFDIKIDEYRKRRPIGGVATPAKTATDTQIELVAAQNAALSTQLEALSKQQASGEGSPPFQGIPSPPP